jgi:heavy metal sensor kinase
MRMRLVAFQVVVMALAALAVDAAAYTLVVTPLQTEFDGSLYDQAHTIMGAAQTDAGKLTFPGGKPPATNEGGVAFETAVIQNDTVTFTGGSAVSARSQLIDAAHQATQNQGGIFIDEQVGRLRRRVYAEPATVAVGDQQIPYVTVVTRSTDDMRNTITRLVVTLAAGTALVVAIGGLLAAWIVGRSLRPVRRLAAAAAAISDRELDQRVENVAPDSELGELVDTFNGMLGRLQASFEGLRRFTADASHELRAPLALMRTQIEVARTKDRTGAEYRELLGRLDHEIQHLSTIAEQLLVLARADANVLSPLLETVDIADLLHEEAQRWTQAAREHRVEVVVEAPDAGEVQAQPDLLRRVVGNLIDNAMRHAPEGSTIRISGARADEVWVIEVADQGPGVPPELRPRLFDRFTRGDAARDPQSGHAGLGLAVSAAIATAHGGHLELVETGAPGAMFRLTLPAV